MMADAAPRPRGLSWGWVIGGAGLVGLVAGVVLALVQISTLPDVEQDAERLAAEASLGVPLRQAEDLTEDPFAPPASAVGGLPRYPGARPRALDPKNLARLPMAIAWFETVDSPSEVIAFYERELQKENIFYNVTRHSDRLVSLGYLDPSKEGGVAAGLLHNVTALVQGERTMVFVSGVVPDELMQVRHQLPAGLRLPVEADPPQVMNVGDIGSEHRVIYTTLKGLPLEGAFSFFKKTLQEDGWRLTDDNERSPERKSLSARRGRDAVSVVLEPSPEGALVLMTHEARGQPEGGPQDEEDMP